MQDLPLFPPNSAGGFFAGHKAGALWEEGSAPDTRGRGGHVELHKPAAQRSHNGPAEDVEKHEKWGTEL